MSAVQVRALEPGEWRSFREFRLSALKAAPGVFATFYEEAVARTPDEWKDTIVGPDHQAFGLFDGEHLIGIAAVFTWREDPSGETAVLAMSFILPDYRGRGLARSLYEARLGWVRARAKFKRVVVEHRATNDIARWMILRQGFRPISRAPRHWPDGSVVDEILYELPLRGEAC